MTTRKVKGLDELAQSVPPPRDLWPAIAQAIEADQAAAAPQGQSGDQRRRARWMRRRPSRPRTTRGSRTPSAG